MRFQLDQGRANGGSNGGNSRRHCHAQRQYYRQHQRQHVPDESSTDEESTMVNTPLMPMSQASQPAAPAERNIMQHSYGLREGTTAFLPTTNVNFDDSCSSGDCISITSSSSDSQLSCPSTDEAISQPLHHAQHSYRQHQQQHQQRHQSNTRKQRSTSLDVLAYAATAAQSHQQLHSLAHQPTQDPSRWLAREDSLDYSYDTDTLKHDAKCIPRIGTTATNNNNNMDANDPGIDHAEALNALWRILFQRSPRSKTSPSMLSLSSASPPSSSSSQAGKTTRFRLPATRVMRIIGITMLAWMCIAFCIMFQCTGWLTQIGMLDATTIRLGQKVLQRSSGSKTAVTMGSPLVRSTIPLPLPKQKVSVILMNYSRPRMIRDSSMMRTLLSHPSIDEVLLLHSNRKTAFEFDHPKVVNIDAIEENEEMGLSLRFYFCQLAKNDWVLHLDDDMEFTSAALDEMLIEYGRNPRRIVGRFGRNLQLEDPTNTFNGYSSTSTHKSSEVVLTKLMVMERETCSSFFQYSHLLWDDVVLHDGEGPLWNGEDIFMSLVANHIYGPPADGRPFNNYAMDWLDVWQADDSLKDYNNGKLDISGGLKGLNLLDWKWWQTLFRRNRHYSYRGQLWQTAKERLAGLVEPK